MSTPFQIALLAALGLACAFTGARAQTSRLAVLEALGPGEPAHLARLTDLARAAAQAGLPDVLVLTRDNLEALLPPGVALADCDAECEVDAGRFVGADWVLGLRITPVPSGHTVTATLFDTREGLLVGHGTAQASADALDGSVEVATQTAIRAWRARSAATSGSVRELVATPRPGTPRTLALTADTPIEVLAGPLHLGRTPLKVPLGAAPTIDLILRAEGRPDERVRIATGGGSAALHLVRDPSHGHLDLRAVRALPDLEDAVVEVDGLPLPLESVEPLLRKGVHQVRLRHPCGRAAPVAVQIAGDAVLSIPIEALVRCRIVRVEADLDDAAVEIGTRPRPLPTPILVDAGGRTARFTVPDGAPQAVVVPGDAAAIHRVQLASPRYPVTVSARYRSGDPCHAPLHVDGDLVGITPWTGTLERRTYRLTTTCQAQIDQSLAVRGEAGAILEEPFGHLEVLTTLYDPFGGAAVGIRLWTPLRDRVHLGVSLHLGATLDEARGTATAEVLAAVPLRWFDLALAPGLTLEGPTLSLLTRGHWGPFTADLGYGVNPTGHGPVLRVGYLP